MSPVTLEVLLPEKVDAQQLSAAVKVTLAAGTRTGEPIKVTTSAAVDRVTLQVSADGELSSIKLVEPNSIVRYLTGSTLLKSELIAFEELAVFQAVKNSSRLDDNVSEQLSKFLIGKLTKAEEAITFGSLHALVCSKGRPVLAANAGVLMWYQKQFSDPRVKSAIVPALRLNFVKPQRQEPSTAERVMPVSEETKTAKKRELPPPVEVPTEIPTIDPKFFYPEQVKPILPQNSQRNILITSALPYVNNVPHLGNVVGSTLSADFYSRYSKARGHNTLFICGTDEYGTATETKALEENVTPYELCTHFHKIHKEVYDWFQIDFDHFGRTSTKMQTEIAQGIFLKLLENENLSEGTTTQLFCEEHQGFLADRYVEGTCSKCGFHDARGDQCDGCGQLLDPLELINPRCKLDATTPVKRDTKHMFLNLDKLQPTLEAWLDTRMSRWPKNAQTIVQNWLKEGLRPRSITRDLKWGTPVPLPDYEGKVFYVWFDAPIGYPSITANYTDKWEQWWKPQNSEDIELYQFMGKDNAPFHAVVFPSTELGTGDNWKMVDYLSTTEFLNYEGGKFSKSRNTGVFGTDARITDVPASVWRYYLASVRPETGDTQFSWADFVTRNNSELLANLGNFVNRVVKFTIAKYGGGIPLFDVPPHDSSIYKEFASRYEQYLDAMERVQLREGIELAMRFSARGNQYLQESKLDNTLFAEHPQECAEVIGVSLNMIYVLSAMIYPFMPETSIQICKQLNSPLRRISDTLDFALKPGHRLGKAQYLFTRIDSAKIDEWVGKFGGGAALEKEHEAERKAKKEKKLAKKQAMKQQASKKDSPAP